jgi:hypothetical protein
VTEPEPEVSPVEQAVVTGHATVDDALDGLAQAAGLTPEEQVPSYEAAHRALQQTLATIDQS